MKKPTDEGLTKLAEAAFEQAAQKVIERAVASGTPVIVWVEEEVKMWNRKRRITAHR